jgi:hypothetical protein
LDWFFTKAIVRPSLNLRNQGCWESDLDKIITPADFAKCVLHPKFALPAVGA